MGKARERKSRRDVVEEVDEGYEGSFLVRNYNYSIKHVTVRRQ